MKLPWEPSYELIAQEGHVLLGLVGVLGTKAFSGNIRTIIWGTGITLAFGFCKEFVFDHLVEQDSWGEDAKDFSFISLGVGLAWAAIGLSYVLQ
jgi:hypothetical protein